MMPHQYRISVLIYQTSLGRETSGSVAKCQLFSQAFLCQLTANGSACSQEIGAPHDAGRIRSGRDSGTAIKMNKRSEAATNVANATTALSSYIFPI